jgi:hypothetical protein
MLKSRISKLAVAVTMIAAAAGLTAITAGGASAAITTHTVRAAYAAPAQSGYLVCNGYACLADHGHGYLITDDSSTYTTFTFTNGQIVNGNPAYLMRMNGGHDCLNVASNGYVYDDACASGDHNELWWFYANGAIKNVHTGLNMTATGGYVYTAGGPLSLANCWSPYC